MSEIKKILVANDELKGVEFAIGKAAIIEHYTGAEVEVAEVLWDEIEEMCLVKEQRETIVKALVNAESRRLNKVMNTFNTRIAWPEARILWAKHSDRAIVDEVERQGSDLLIKPGRSYGLSGYVHAPLDWRLIRHATCPVLISKSEDWQTGGVVLAAVDVGTTSHAQLNEKVLLQAMQFASILDATLHIVCVHSDLGQSVNDLQVAMDYEGIKADMRQARASSIDKLLSKLRIDGAISHVLEGKPAPVIAKLANQLDATLTVMGTSARHGLGKLVIGNTAEDILSLLEIDVVTVRV